MNDFPIIEELDEFLDPDEFRDPNEVVRDFYMNCDVSKFGFPENVEQAFALLAARARAQHEQDEMVMEEIALDRWRYVQAFAQDFSTALDGLAEGGVGDDDLSKAVKKVAAFILSLADRDIPEDELPSALDTAITAMTSKGG